MASISANQFPSFWPLASPFLLYKVCIYPKTPSFMGFDESTWISCVNETYAICLPRILKILFIGGQCDKSMSRGSNLCNSDGIGVGTAYCVMEYGDESLTLTVCWIIKVWSEYRIGSRFSSRKRKVCLYDCMYMYIHKEPTHESRERQAWGRTPFEVNTNYFLFIFNRCQSPFLILFFDAPCFILLCFLFVLFVWIGWGWCGWGDYSADQYCRAVGSSVSKMVSVDGPSIQKRKCSIPNQLTLCFSLVPSTFLSSYSFFEKFFSVLQGYSCYGWSCFMPGHEPSTVWCCVEHPRRRCPWCNKPH